MVTHDIAITQAYADRIIEMDQGCVIKDVVINQVNQNSEQGIQKEKKSLKDAVHFVFKDRKSRIQETLTTIVLSFLCMFAIFGVLDLYQNVQSQSDYLTTFKDGRNLILSVPKLRRSNQDGRFRAVYQISEFYSASDIQKAVEENAEIIAVETFYSQEYVLGDGLSGGVGEELGPDVFRTFTLEGYNDINGNPFVYVNRPREYSFISRADINEIEQTDFTMYRDTVMYEYPLSMFDLAHDYKALPLFEGKMPSNEKEIVLSKNTADIFMKISDYADYSEMIGKPFIIGTQGFLNTAFGVIPYTTTYTVEGEQAKRVENFEFTISGISSVENENLNMVFFDNGVMNNPVLNYFVLNKENLSFDYVRFLVEPGSDTAAIAAKINETLYMEDASIEMYQGRGFGKEKKVYQLPTPFIMYGFILFLVLVFILMIHYFFNRNRMIKENILKNYGYSLTQEQVIRSLICNGGAFILVLVLGNPICGMLNKVASKMQYQSLLTMNATWILVAFLIVFVIHALIETVMINTKVKK